jgi:peptidylprolyl isomerase
VSRRHALSSLSTRLGESLAAAAACLLLLTGCGPVAASPTTSATATVSDLAAVVVHGAEGARPAVTVPTPFSVATTQRLVLRTGTGRPVKSGQRVTIHYVGVNGVDGHEFVTDYGKRASAFVLSPANNLKGIVDGLAGTPIGSRLLLAIPPADAYGLGGRPEAKIGPTDTLLIVIDLLDAKDVLTRATGRAVPRKAGLPTVTLDQIGRPKITLPTGTPGGSLVVQPLIVGAGAKVAKGDQISVQYAGVIWPGGRQFDSSWSAPTPASFAVGDGRLIAGWDEGLVGQTVGSQILLVVPPDKGYGAAGKQSAGIKGTDTLVFVVDILDTANPGPSG